ncbi:MAG: hypothetical protein AAFQ81_19305, partial [Pseudomonadota bacterium]
MSGIVLMLAIGTLVQRQDLVADFFGDGSAGDGELVLRPDDISVSPDTLTRIDVLANDSGVGSASRNELEVLSQPGCGRVFVQAGALQFLAENDCEATQQIAYGLANHPDLERGTVTVRVIGATGTRNAPEPAPSRGLVLARPTLKTASADEESSAVAVEKNTAPQRPLPAIVVPGAGSQPTAPEASTTRVAAAPRPSAPGSSRPAAPGQASSPSAPQIGGLRAPSSPGSLGSGVLVSETSPSIGGSSAPSVPSRPGGGAATAPSAPGALAGLSVPSAPASVGLPGGSAPSIPAPSQPGSAPSQRSGGGTTLALAQPGVPQTPSAARPQSPAPSTGAGNATGSSRSVVAPSVPAPSAPSASAPSVPTAQAPSLPS